MQRAHLCLTLVLIGCAASEPELPGDPGHITGACIDDLCLGGAVCLSELCVDPSAGDGEPDDDGSDDSVDGTDSGSATDTATGDSTDGADSTDDADSSADASDDASSVTSADTDGGPTPDGGTCDEDDECQSGHCFLAGVLGGVCGECEVDRDCEGGGCSLPNPTAQPPIGSMCNSGALGDGCMSDEACAGGLVCAEILEVPGIIYVSACSECESDADCAGSSLCVPDIAIANLGGAKLCAAPGSVANGATCDFAGTGDASCASGHCAVADVMGVLELGICSECEDDGDCGGAQICEPPLVDLDSIDPAMCG